MTQTSDGHFQFSLVAGDGQVVATSESHPLKASALEIIKSIQKGAHSAAIDDELCTD